MIEPGNPKTGDGPFVVKQSCGIAKAIREFALELERERDLGF